MNPLLSGLLRILLLAAGLAVTILPRRLELALGRLLGLLALAAGAKRKRIAEKNMRLCLPGLSERDLRSLLRANAEHYGVLGIELLHMFSPFPGHWPAYVKRVSRLEGFEHWRRAHERGKGVLFVSAHLANWEIMAAQAALSGIPALTLATRHLKPEWLHLWMRDVRLSAGVRCAFLPDTLPSILKTLRRGETVGFGLDQYAHPPMGIPVSFFGVQTDTLGSVGTLSQRYGAPIIPAYSLREPDGLVRIVFEPALELGEDIKGPVKATQAMSDKIEGWIRANPAQWLWVHRRFKNATWPEPVVKA